jgi:hypothetical protein
MGDDKVLNVRLLIAQVLGTMVKEENEMILEEKIQNLIEKIKNDPVKDVRERYLSVI